MDATISTFLNILKAALSEEKFFEDREIPAEEWDNLFQMARIHNVLPLFYEAVFAAPSAQAAQPVLAAARRPVTRQVVMQTRQTSEFLELNRRLQAAGIHPLVVKGIICRNLYHEPDHRPSGDEDVLIPPEQFDECHRVLTEFGMQTAMLPDEMANAYEVPYTKPGSPLYIELHKHLFPPQSDAYGDMNRFFAGVHDRAVAEELPEGTVYTLESTDHLFYLICHAFKHFLHSGFGIRQVCDIVLYANAYGSRVDWLQILENCKCLHAEKFAAALFQIGSKHLVFDPDCASYPEVWRQIQVDEMPMLEDLLCGGLYGDSSMSRKHSSNITLDAVVAQKQGRKAKNAVIASAFPSVTALETRYPYLKKHPYLLPAAWGSRLLEYARKSGHSQDNNASEALKIGNERVELMKEYGILK
jgi:hypothetical protein